MQQSSSPSAKAVNDIASRDEVMLTARQHDIRIRTADIEPLYTESYRTAAQTALMTQFEEANFMHRAHPTGATLGRAGIAERISILLHEEQVEHRYLQRAGIAGPDTVFITGPSCGGKSSHGRTIAASLGSTLVDGDVLHPQENVDIMKRGDNLSAAHRAEWLDRIDSMLQTLKQPGVMPVVICSALTQHIRAQLEDMAGEAIFIDCTAPLPVLQERARHRSHPYIPNYAAQQFIRTQHDLHEQANTGEMRKNLITIDTSTDPADVCREWRQWLNTRLGLTGDLALSDI